MTDPIIFDRRQVRRQRDRAAATIAAHDFLLREGALRLIDRLEDVTRKFPLALDLGCHHGELAAGLRGRFGIERLIAADLSPAMARLAGAAGLAGPAGAAGLAGPAGAAGLSVAADEEALPFAEGRFDLVVSNLSLHWVNDLPGALLQIRRILKPDGLFLAGMLGGETLRELRQCLLEAELEQEGGAGPRVSPFVEVRDAGALLQRAGFALPVADIEDVAVTYGNPFTLLSDLRGMGETNALAARRRSFSRRGTIGRAMALYQERHGDAEGRLPATFQIVTLTGWSPAR